jgi:hypothetical protein
MVSELQSQSIAVFKDATQLVNNAIQRYLDPESIVIPKHPTFKPDQLQYETDMRYQGDRAEKHHLILTINQELRSSGSLVQRIEIHYKKESSDADYILHNENGPGIAVLSYYETGEIRSIEKVNLVDGELTNLHGTPAAVYIISDNNQQQVVREIYAEGEHLEKIYHSHQFCQESEQVLANADISFDKKSKPASAEITTTVLNTNSNLIVRQDTRIENFLNGRLSDSIGGQPAITIFDEISETIRNIHIINDQLIPDIEGLKKMSLEEALLSLKGFVLNSIERLEIPIEDSHIRVATGIDADENLGIVFLASHDRQELTSEILLEIQELSFPYRGNTVLMTNALIDGHTVTPFQRFIDVETIDQELVQTLAFVQTSPTTATERERLLPPPMHIQDRNIGM